MKTNNYKSQLTSVALIVLLASAGCQPVSITQPTATPTVTPAPTPTVEPTEIVMAEREVSCPIRDFEELQESTTVNDPSLGDVERGWVVKFRYSCSEHYLKGKAVGVQNLYKLAGGHFDLVAYNEIITDEGGVWKGFCELRGWCKDCGQFPTMCMFNGEGKYKGLEMDMNYNLDNGDAKFRVIKLDEE